MTTNTAQAASSNLTKMTKGAQWGLEHFDEALKQLNAARNDCEFATEIQNDAEILRLFAERLQSAANKLHEQCNLR
jgi:hypothetical protein